MSLIIHAPNIHQGGGRVLLLTLLKSLRAGIARQVILDTRLQLENELPSSVQLNRVPPTITGRLMAEWRLRHVARNGDTVLCFGNLPPLFPLRARVVVYVQNRYQVDRRGLGNFPPAVRYRLWFEHRWFDFGCRWVDEFIVQTPSMQRGIKKRFGIFATVMPFVDLAGKYSRRVKKEQRLDRKKYDFVYIASGEPHKNHRKLIDAWCILAQNGIRPTLCLTLNAESATELFHWIEMQKKKFKLKIELVKATMKENINGLYKNAGALIYPSTIESFGLPLIEARQAGLPIVAAELDYVRDLIDPEESFDPHSSYSIAHAVKRFMGKADDELHILDAKSFLSLIINKS